MRTEYTYRAVVERDEDGAYIVSFPDLPEALTGADDLQEALELAEDCLAEALATRIVERDEIPAPSPIGEGDYAISCPPQIAMKVALNQAMFELETTKAALAELLDVNEKEARRIADPHHNTKLPTLWKALRALGKRVQVVVEDAVATG